MNANSRDCPVCRQQTTVADRVGVLKTNHPNLAPATFLLMNCHDCGLVFISPAPTADDIRGMYSETVQFSDEKNYRGERASAVTEYFTGRVIALRNFLLSGGGVMKQLRILEVGAGLSWMCRAAKIVDPTSVTIAQDVTAEAVNECDWVDEYVVSDLMKHSAVAERGPFEIISMTHVIEHLVEPIEILRRLRELISQNGVVFITAPYRPIGWTRDDGTNKWSEWSYNHVPGHVQYFTRESLARASADAGFELKVWDSAQDGGQAFEAWLVPAM